MEVDTKNNRILGYVVAQTGPFKSKRGEFDSQSLSDIVRLMNAAPNGVKSRFTHPGMSDDGLGKFLGRATNARIDGNLVRADLQISPTSFATPNGDLGGYVLRLAKEDPAALSSSLVLRANRTRRLDANGRPIKNEKGEEMPDLWHPTQIHASDIVDTGDAVDSLLSADDLSSLPDGAVRQAYSMLDQVFAGQPREVTQERLAAFVGRYLSQRYGELEDLTDDNSARILLEKIKLFGSM